MQADERIMAWQGCTPAVVAAVDSFCDRWKPYSTKSRARSIFKLFDEVIEPAWNSYIEALPTEHSGRELCRDLRLGQLARTVGFGTLETIVAATLREYCNDEEDFYNQMTPDLSFWTEAAKHTGFNSDHEFEATLETILVVARECHSKRPKKLKNGRSNRLYQDLCEYCGANTELSAQAKGESRTGYEPDGAARLSAKYCWGHRPKFLDGTRNPEYIWAVRHKTEFDTEVRRLRLQATSMGEPRAKTDDACVDLFYLNLLGPRAIYPDEVAILRNEARQLVDLRVDDKKKRMIIMRASGFSLAAIADAVGAKSRQAIGKALASVPAKYRFDLMGNEYSSDETASTSHCIPPSSRDSVLETTTSAAEAFLEGLNGAVTTAMQDPDIVEILLNPDGILWAELRTIGRRKIGTVCASDAEKIIRFVANKCGISITAQNPIIMVDLPAARARFTGVLPPITDSPTFGIRKMRAEG
jgi:hypothetical protein